MISNITHQWKQPLSNINGIIINIDNDYRKDRLDKKALNDYLDEMENTTVYMSDTIRNFMNFFSPTKDKEIFYINELLDGIHNMLSSALKSNNITLDMDRTNNLELTTYKSELIQVIMILVNNAKEAFISNEKENRTIAITTYKQDDTIILEIEDNAGGIPENILDRIFEPYFTTKHKSIGTGLGLHMAKNLIENGLGGELIGENIYGEDDIQIGAKFTIKILI
jgi:signal transduction histidine kinase